MGRRRSKKNKRHEAQQRAESLAFEQGREALLNKLYLRRVHAHGGITIGEAIPPSTRSALDL